jgi:hypothetical protein
MQSAPQTAMEMGEHLAELGQRLQNVVDRLTVADRQSVATREAYTVAYARAWRACMGTAEAKKQQATLMTHDERLAAEEADAEVRDLRRRLDAMKMHIEVSRSYGAALRAEISLGMSSFGGP